MGKTFKRDENWDKNKESSLRKEREKYKANRARKDSLDDETDSEDGETNGGFWETSDFRGRF